ncbi:Transmembrane protein [Gossypium arboreum]|uniref:Transmembrane protein n=1 Tax=Gossypium arboreum TaxID=29729 RepID=A0A0B0N3K4_GOSAR|nr:Transmembrane protein [Gossypium arboreum]KHG28739.1 Transmembrane protein [Gossypium arboreum]
MFHAYVGPHAHVAHTAKNGLGRVNHMAWPNILAFPCGSPTLGPHESHMTSLIDHTLLFDHTTYHTAATCPCGIDNHLFWLFVEFYFWGCI